MNNEEIKKIDEITKKEGLRSLMCEVVSDTEHLPTKEGIQKILSEKAEKGTLIQYVYILHDKDVYTEEDEQNGYGKAGELKKPHYHIFMKFKSKRNFDEIANWFNISTNFINKIKARTFDAGCLYAVHANAPQKYQYDIDLATANFDYKALVEVAKNKFKRETNKDKLYKRKMEIVNLIDQGVYNKFNLSDHITAEEEVNFNTAIKIAFDRRQRYLESLTERDLTCIYISGSSGAGKSSFATMLCESLGLSYVKLNGGSKDPFQPYKGQEAIIINDIDFNTFGWKEFLNLADNDNASLAKARYKDVALICKLLIITTTKDPFELVKNIAGAEDEEKKQFYRRFTLFYKLSYNTIKEYHFNSDEKVFKYELFKEMENIALKTMKEKKKRKEENKNMEIDIVKVIQDYALKNGIIILDTTHYERQKQREEEKKLAEMTKNMDLVKVAGKLENDDTKSISEACENQDNDFFYDSGLGFFG